MQGCPPGVSDAQSKEMLRVCRLGSRELDSLKLLPWVHIAALSAPMTSLSQVLVVPDRTRTSVAARHMDQHVSSWGQLWINTEAFLFLGFPVAHTRPSEHPLSSPAFWRADSLTQLFSPLEEWQRNCLLDVSPRKGMISQTSQVKVLFNSCELAVGGTSLVKSKLHVQYP